MTIETQWRMGKIPLSRKAIASPNDVFVDRTVVGNWSLTHTASIVDGDHITAMTLDIKDGSQIYSSTRTLAKDEINNGSPVRIFHPIFLSVVRGFSWREDK
ncbi:hypothetical protein M1349_04615 [Patescibacteria group bacterium]|nr:hypothetical protein [Patescibacteria group bacterium]